MIGLPVGTVTWKFQGYEIGWAGFFASRPFGREPCPQRSTELTERRIATIVEPSRLGDLAKTLAERLGWR